MPEKGDIYWAFSLSILHVDPFFQIMRRTLLFLLLCPVTLLAQQSQNMTLLSNVDIPGLPSRFGSEYNDCWGFRHANGTEVAIIGGIEDIFFYNVTTPGNPSLIYQHHVTNVGTGTTNQSLWRDFKTYGNYAFAAADEGTSGLLVFDLSQVPASISMVYQSNQFWNRTHNIFIDTEHARLYAAGSNMVSAGLVVLNIATPNNPQLIQNIPLTAFGGGYVHDVYVRDNIAYCSHGSLSKMQIYDFNNLPNITVVGTIENYWEAGYNHSSWLNDTGDFLTMCDETHGSDVKLVNVTDPANISNDDIWHFYSELLGPGAPEASVAHNPFIVGDYAYIAYYHDGVQVFDISNPTNIQLLAYYDTYPENVDYFGYNGCWGVYPFLPSGIIIASDQNHGLYVMQITNFPLDIEFLSFEASRQQGGVRLNWAVADASLGNTFEIMRSMDGGITFSSIGQVNLDGTQSNYTYMDRDVYENQKYMYRVDFVELDGKRISSPMRFIRTIETEGRVRIVSPVHSELIVDALEPLAQMEFSLYDVQGNQVWNHQLDASSARMEFSIAGLPPASYVLTIRWDGGSFHRIIQKVE